MHPLWCHFAQNFRHEPGGRIIYFPGGLSGKGRLVPDQGTYRRLVRRGNALWYGFLACIFLLPALLGPRGVLILPIVAVVHLLLLRRLHAGLPEVDVADTWRDRMQRAATCKGRAWLRVELVMALVLAAASLALFYTRTLEYPLAWLLAVLFLVDAGFAWVQLSRLCRPGAVS
jgi:hypothetical protein